MPEGHPKVLSSRGYDEAALLEMGSYVTTCFSTDYNEWTPPGGSGLHASRDEVLRGREVPQEVAGQLPRGRPRSS